MAQPAGQVVIAVRLRALLCALRTCMLCEGVAYGRINAQPCIIFHDSASTLISQRQLLRNLFMETHRARSPKLFYPAKMAATEHMRSDYLVLRVFGAA